MNVLLTGSSRGLGLAIAKVLLAQGATLFLPVRTVTGDLQSLADECVGRLKFILCDLEDSRELRAILGRDLPAESHPIHALVNNAAMAYDDLVSNMQPELLEKMFRVNVFASMELTRLAIRNMLLHRTQGSIVHVSSVCSKTGYKGLAMYGATKGAIEAFSRGVAREWGSHGIRSNCVVPGFMETDMSKGLSDEQKSKIYRRTSLGQATSASSVAATVAFLVSKDSQSVTGQDFVVDSGTL